MGTRKRRSDRSGRASLPSPGRPPVAGRDERSRFWLAIASGMSSEDAALEAGVSQPVGTRWFRKAGGMPPAMFRCSAKPLSGRYLSLAEREEIALLPCRRSGAGSVDPPRRSPVSCGATQPPAAVGWSIARRPPSGMPSDQPVARNRASSRSMRPCALMWRRGWPASSSLRAAFPLPAPPCLGTDAGKARIVRQRARGAALSAHFAYLRREGVTQDGAAGRLFDAEHDDADHRAFAERCEGDRHHFQFIVSPQDAERLSDLKAFTRDLMAQAERDLGTNLDWVGVEHWNTDNPHIHVIVRGKGHDGHDLVMARDYVSQGLRARAAHLATLELGPRSDLEIRRDFDAQVEADRWTKLDRALAHEAAQHDGVVARAAR